MSVNAGSASSALNAMTNSGTPQLQQRIAAKVVMDQLESEAALVTKLVESGSPTASSSGVGSRVDRRDLRSPLYLRGHSQ
jgi:hypothetical protein